MNLAAGLTRYSPAWTELLLQCGVPVERVQLDAGQMWKERCSVLVVNGSLTPHEAGIVAEYLQGGGAVLGWARYLTACTGQQVREEPLEYLFSEGDPVFAGVDLLDLGVPGVLSREANHLRTGRNSPAVFAGEWKGGVLVAFPFDPGMAMADQRIANKAFYARGDRLPSERVSLVSRGDLRHLVGDALAYVHHQRGLPFVSLASAPLGSSTVFAFRIDTDGATSGDLGVLYRLCREHDVPASWFLDLHSQEHFLDQYAAMVGQEIGVHCYLHRPFETRTDVAADLDRAHSRLVAAGFTPRGGAAPYGYWTPVISRLAHQYGWEYTSEFGCVYDTTPMFPVVQEETPTVIQIPVHPVSVGSLRRAGFTGQKMQEYYRGVALRKRMMDEPLLFYHHPGHRAWEVVADLLAEGGAAGTRRMTFLDYARWARGRRNVSWSVEAVGTELRVTGVPDLLAADLALRIIRSAGEQATHAPVPRIDLATLSWRPIDRPPARPDIRRVREFDPRRMLGDLYTTMLRRIR